MKLTGKDISVIVQGPVQEKYTFRCVHSIRQLLPDAELILSTWRGSSVEDIDYDILVLSDDPGAERLTKINTATNSTNRQLVSTRNGLERASRDYVLKIRSDMEIKSLDFLDYYERHRTKGEYFTERVLFMDYFTRNPIVIPMPYHPSDWLLFGRKTDVCSYFDVPMMSKEDMLYFTTHENTSHLFNKVLHKYSPEQWYCINFLKKHQPIKCNCYYDNSTENLAKTLRFFASDCIIYPYENRDVLFLKYDVRRFRERCTLLTNEDWLSLQNNKIPKCYYHRSMYFIRKMVINILSYLKLKDILHNFIEKRFGQKCK